MARLPMWALKRRTQVGDNLAMPRYRDLFALLRFAEKLGELILASAMEYVAIPSLSFIFWLSMARIAERYDFGKAQARA